MNVIEFPERRRRRSSNAYQAIKFQLEHIFDRRALRSFALGDERGIPIAWAGHSEEAEVLMAYAPLLAATVDRKRRTEIFDEIRAFIPDASESSIVVRTFNLDGEVLHMCVHGHADMQQTDLYRAISGVRRILKLEEFAA